LVTSPGLNTGHAIVLFAFELSISTRILSQLHEPGIIIE